MFFFLHQNIFVTTSIIPFAYPSFTNSLSALIIINNEEESYGARHLEKLFLIMGFEILFGRKNKNVMK